MSGKFVIQNLMFKFSSDSSLFFEQEEVRFQSGSVYIITGKNGVGKSTLFRLMQCIVYPEEVFKALITINGHVFDVSQEQERNRLRASGMIQVVPQQVRTMFAQGFTVKDHMALLKITRYPSLKAVPCIDGIKLLTQVGIDLDSRIENLSGGQLQIVATALMMQNDCRILLLDEPTANLDKKNTMFVLDLIGRFAQEKNVAVLIISHDQETVTLHDPSKVLEIVEDKGIRYLTQKK